MRSKPSQTIAHLAIRLHQVGLRIDEQLRALAAAGILVGVVRLAIDDALGDCA
jgi:hypothetical protein